MATEESKKMKKSPLFVLGLLVLLCAGVFLVMRLAGNDEPPDTFSAADMEATNVVIRTRIAKSGRTSTSSSSFQTSIWRICCWPPRACCRRSSSR